MKNIVIHSELEYEEAAKRIEELKDAPAGSSLAEELKSLTKAVIQYQRRNESSSDFGSNGFKIKF